MMSLITSQNIYVIDCEYLYANFFFSIWEFAGVCVNIIVFYLV